MEYPVLPGAVPQENPYFNGNVTTMRQMPNAVEERVQMVQRIPVQRVVNYDQPVNQVYQQPVMQPVYQQPVAVQAQVYQQPVAAQVYQQPFTSAPVQVKSKSCTPLTIALCAFFVCALIGTGIGLWWAFGRNKPSADSEGDDITSTQDEDFAVAIQTSPQDDDDVDSNISPQDDSADDDTHTSHHDDDDDDTHTSHHGDGGCYQGYAIAADGNCVDINECASDALNDCGTTGTCVNTQGSYICSCIDGYRGGKGCACKDIDECRRRRPGKHGGNICGDAGTCQNTEGSYICNCNSGYSADSDGTCADVNECADDTLNNCNATQTCKNLAGGYTCHCESGYVANGGTCVDVDECVLATLNNCDATQTCQNVAGSHTCPCKTGYTAYGTTCVVARSYGGFTYWLLPTAKTYADAKATCIDGGGHLAYIQIAHEASKPVVTALFSDTWDATVGAWIGLHDYDGWQWGGDETNGGITTSVSSIDWNNDVTPATGEECVWMHRNTTLGFYPSGCAETKIALCERND